MEEHYRFIITGSAKLAIFKKAGDGLAGRYFTFHLYPLGLWEIVKGGEHRSPSSPSTAQGFLSRQLDKTEPADSALSALLEHSGFPEPFLRQSRPFYTTWSRDYMDTVVKEDIGALTRIIDREYLHDLAALLPDMVGSPLSESSLAGHLQISQPTIKNHLRRLGDFFIAFKVPPYSKNIKRALLKAPKAYLFDWARVSEAGKRFENFLAVQLLARISLWQEKSGQAFSLFYVRNKQKEETDFLILKEKKPWLLVEAKLGDGPVDRHHRHFQEQLGGIPLVQVCRQPGVAALESKNTYRLSASRFLS